MQQYSLNKLYSHYTMGIIKRAEFEGYIYRYYLTNQEKTCLSHWNRDDYEDYISWFYQRLHKAIDAYNDIGFTFETYMVKFIQNSSREYRVRKTTNSITEYSVWSARVPELYAHEEPPDYSHEKSNNIIKKLVSEQSGRKESRRILALVLKCYYYISDDFIDHIAPKIGIDKKELREMMTKIREIRQKKDDEIYQMKERIYRQYYRCLVYEKRLSHIPENTISYSKLKYRMEKARKILENMRKRITLIRTEATNKQVAEVIGISKGTVDASLHKLKIRLNTLSGKANLN